LGGIGGTSNRPSRPELDQRVDELREGVLGDQVEDLVQRHVRVERPHEEERRGARIVDAHAAGRGGAGEVVRDDRDAAAGRAVGRVGVERHDERPRPPVHVDDDVLGDALLGERHEPLREAAQHGARVVLRGVHTLELGDERWNAPTHRGEEERLLRAEVPEDGRRRDAELAGDVGERRAVEALRRERLARRREDLIAADPRGSAHL
jgi:hypothetical protein